MLRELLHLVESAAGPISLAEVSRRTGIDPGALVGMLDYWVRKGRLTVDQDMAACSGACAPLGAGCHSCTGATCCPFIARLPIAYSVVSAVVEKSDFQSGPVEKANLSDRSK
jgi:hypothetical protein